MGWTQEDLAGRLSIGTSTVGMWCTGKSFPKRPTIIKLIELGMNAREIFGEKAGDILVKNSILANQEKLPHADAIINTPEFREELLKALKMLKDEGY